MTTIQIGNLPPRDVEDFLVSLDRALVKLDTLAQMQAMVGGLSMQSHASDTFNLHARLENYARMLKYTQERINR